MRQGKPGPEETAIGLGIGDTLTSERLGLVLRLASINGRGAVLMASFKDGSKAWSEEVLAGEFLLTKQEPPVRLDGIY